MPKKNSILAKQCISLTFINEIKPDRVVQSETCPASDASLTADPGVTS